MPRDTPQPPLPDEAPPPRLDEAQLLCLASEELRGPLTSVSGFLQLLIDGETGELSPGQSRVAEIAARNAEKMARMIDELIVIAQVRTSGLAPARTPVDVAELVRERVYAVSGDLRARRAAVSFSSDPCPAITADQPSIEQMVDQMLRGAVTFVPINGRIDVGVHAMPDGVVLEVGDNGGELDQSDVPDIFTGLSAFAPKSPRALVGSRMGLQLVREVAWAHGGDAAVETRDGRTIVRVTLAGGARS